MNKYIIRCRNMAHARYILWWVSTRTNEWFPRPHISKNDLTIELPNLIILLAVDERQLVGRRDWSEITADRLFYWIDLHNNGESNG